MESKWKSSCSRGECKVDILDLRKEDEEWQIHLECGLVNGFWDFRGTSERSQLEGIKMLELRQKGSSTRAHAEGKNYDI